jgi:hypothetical protein
MGLRKGVTNNPNGRPKGSLNKTTKELKETVLAFLERNMADLQSNYNQLEPKDKLLFFDKLMRYVMPTQAAVKADVNYEDEQEQTLIIQGKKFARQDVIASIAERINAIPDNEVLM